MRPIFKSPTNPARLFSALFAVSSLSLTPTLHAAEPIKAKTAQQLVEKIFETSKTSQPLANFLLKLDYTTTTDASMKIGDNYKLPLPKGKHKIGRAHV